MLIRVERVAVSVAVSAFAASGRCYCRQGSRPASLAAAVGAAGRWGREEGKYSQGHPHKGRAEDNLLNRRLSHNPKEAEEGGLSLSRWPQVDFLAGKYPIP